MNLQKRRGTFVVLSIVCCLHPLLRFASSPSFDVIRAVDMLLLFASGLGAGVLVALLMQRRHDAASSSAE